MPEIYVRCPDGKVRPFKTPDLGRSPPLGELRTPETLILADGQEVFTSFLQEGHYYEFLVSGMIDWRTGFFSLSRRADPCYVTDNQGNFTLPVSPNNHPHIQLTLPAFEPAPFPTFMAKLKSHGDRATHTYRLMLKAEERGRVSARIERPHCLSGLGFFKVVIVERPDILQAEFLEQTRRAQEERIAQERAMAAAQKAQREQAQRELERAQEEERQSVEREVLKEEERFRQEEEKFIEEKRRRNQLAKSRRARLRMLETIYKDFPHYSDPEWIENHARTHLLDLLQNRDHVLSGLLAFHKDEHFIEILREKKPELYERARWRTKSLAAAERLEVLPPPEEKQRPRLTPEEWRERRAKWLRIKAEDSVALQKSVIEAIKDHREFLDQYEIGHEERARYEGEFLDDVYKTIEDRTSNKGGNDNGGIETL